MTSVDFDAWVAEYKKLRALARELDAFVHERYEKTLAAIAREFVDENPGLVRYGCAHCEVQVTTLIEAVGWYFEWQCGGDRFPEGRCDADTFGWHVPLEDVYVMLTARATFVP